MNDLESAEKIAIDIEKLERNLKQVAHITFEGSEKEVYDRAIDYKNDSKYSFGKISFADSGVSNALKKETIDDKKNSEQQNLDDIFVQNKSFRFKK